jgi:hypothetical protein
MIVNRHPSIHPLRRSTVTIVQLGHWTGQSPQLRITSHKIVKGNGNDELVFYGCAPSFRAPAASLKSSRFASPLHLVVVNPATDAAAPL